MKLVKAYFAILLAIVSLTSCKKDKDPVDWSKNLNGTVWAGEFQYTSGVYTGLQPFSIAFTNSGITWYDISGDYTGTWTVENNNQLTIQFTSGSKFTADIGKTDWTNFKNVTSHNWKVVNTSQSSVPDPHKLETIKLTGSQEGTDLSIEFLSPTQLRATRASGGTNMNYTVRGSGISFSFLNFEKSYGIFVDNGKTLKGIYNSVSTIYQRWSVSK